MKTEQPSRSPGSLSLTELLAEPARVADVPARAVPDLLAELERIRVRLWARLSDRAAEPIPGPEPLLSVPEVARVLRVVPSHVYELARSGSLPSVRFGKYVRVRPEALREWLQHHEEHKRLDGEGIVAIPSRHAPQRPSRPPQAAPPYTSRVRRLVGRERAHGETLGGRDAGNA